MAALESTLGELMEIGYVTRSHGLRGEVRVHLHWEESDALDHIETVWLAKTRGQKEPGPRRQHRIYGARRTPQGYLLSLEGSDDKSAADALKGSTLFVERSKLPQLAAGEYYLSDLVGFSVWLGDRRIGEVTKLSLHPSVDCVVFKTEDGRELEQPLLEPWLKGVDVEASRVNLTSLDGVIE